MTNYDQWQAERFGNILEEPNLEIEEPGELESEKAERFSNNEHEKQLNELQ